VLELPPDLLTLLREPSPAYIATLMPDGAPHVTQVWIDTDGQHVLVNTVVGHQKQRNIERDPRVAVTVSDPTLPRRYFQVRGRVVVATTEGAAEHIDRLSLRYVGAPYTPWGDTPQTRILLAVEPLRITRAGG
jgi:PPOX class probable F420-dependent enzyme